MGSELRNDNRAVSEALAYLFVLGITIVFAALVFPAFSIVGDASEYQMQDQMDTESHRLKGAIEEVDRRVRSSESTGPIGIHISLSDRIGNNQYEIEVVQQPGGDQYLILRTLSGDLTTRLEVESETQLKNTTIPGGDIYIIRKAADSKISVVSEE